MLCLFSGLILVFKCYFSIWFTPHFLNSRYYNCIYRKKGSNYIAYNYFFINVSSKCFDCAHSCFDSFHIFCNVFIFYHFLLIKSSSETSFFSCSYIVISLIDVFQFDLHFMSYSIVF